MIKEIAAIQGIQTANATIFTISSLTNCTGGLFHCYLLDKPIGHFRGVGCILPLFYFGWKNLLANNIEPDGF